MSVTQRWAIPPIFLAVLGLTGCFDIERPGPKTDPALEPPISRKLNHKDGTSITYQICGRSRTDLWVKDKSDPVGRVTLLKIAVLTPEDETFVRKIPEVINLIPPISVTLTNLQGRSIAAKVEGRNATTIRFRKADDQFMRVYDFPLASLSQADQQLLGGLPVVDLVSIHVESPTLLARRRALALAHQKLSQLQAQAKTEGVSGNRFLEMTPALKQAEAEIQKLTQEVKDLGAEEKLRKK